ncbi:MAG: fatty acid desaturase [Paracoccaceae bacterium]|nr:fatty acid desaturase [Paracoccaceae bacterium]
MAERPAVEWPTLGMILATYALWGIGTTVAYAALPPLGFFLTTLAIVQFSSLQHEVLHGHPFASRRLSEALVFPGLTLFVPYRRFRDTHLAHHRDERLTDPYDDPESNYLDPAVWARLSAPLRVLLRVNNTLLGRILLGPAISTWALLRGDTRAIRAGDRAVREAWAWHLPGVALVALWLWATPGIGALAYLGAAYLGYGILKIRTFLEHRAHERARGRSVIVEDRGPLSLLFLNNNFHAVHHAKPGAAWYRLPALYRENRAEYLRRNEGYLFRSYGEIFSRYFLIAKDPVPHPLWPDGIDRAAGPEESPAIGPALSAAFAPEPEPESEVTSA